VQQKVCTGNAVVKPGKLYVVQAQIGLYCFQQWKLGGATPEDKRVECLSPGVIQGLDE